MRTYAMMHHDGGSTWKCVDNNKLKNFGVQIIHALIRPAVIMLIAMTTSCSLLFYKSDKCTTWSPFVTCSKNCNDNPIGESYCVSYGFQGNS